MGRVWHDLERLLRLQLRKGMLVEFDHTVVEPTDNQQRRCGYIVEPRIREIRAAATRHHGANAGAQLCRSDQRGRRSGAGSEKAEWQGGKRPLGGDLMGEIYQACGER